MLSRKFIEMTEFFDCNLTDKGNKTMDWKKWFNMWGYHTFADRRMLNESSTMNAEDFYQAIKARLQSELVLPPELPENFK